jgi:5'-methylthioadenosine phosphorylase
MTSARSDNPPNAEIGIIGGSGLYELPGLEGASRIDVDTPFGRPSDAIALGVVAGRRVAFLARHGVGHRILPGELPVQANLWALKSLGVERVLSVSAVGSLRPHIEPLQAVVPDQLIDRTSRRVSTFFGDGLVAHIGFADPFCPELTSPLGDAVEATGVFLHRGGSLVVIEGPAFSTRAESALYRDWNADIVGMTALPEAKLAREAELCYAALCFVTDYDVWHESEADVSAAIVMQRLQQNAAHGVDAVVRTIEALPATRACACGRALDDALITPRDLVPAATRERLALLLRRPWDES